MRQLSLACLLVVAALSMTGCAGRSFLAGGGCDGCSSCRACAGCGGRGCGMCGGAGMIRCGERMFGQNGAGLDPGGMGMCGTGCGVKGYFASGWRGGHCNQEYRKDQPPYGPPTAQVGYPYYTTRGPRDFLVDNPPSIGR